MPVLAGCLVLYFRALSPFHENSKPSGPILAYRTFVKFHQNFHAEFLKKQQTKATVRATLLINAATKNLPVFITCAISSRMEPLQIFCTF